MSDQGSVRRIVHRQSVLLVVLAVALALCASGVVTLWQLKLIKLPWLDTPAATVEVRHDVLTQQLVVSGTVVVDAVPVRSWLRVSPAIVTVAPPAVGAKLSEGDVVVEVSGRPIIVLAGQTPGYRTMSSGMVGKDVSELQAGLQRLGLFAGAFREGTYDAATAQAVSRLYRDRGYNTCETTAVCLGEVVFLPSLPSTVASVGTRLGDEVSTVTPLLSVQAGQIGVVAVLSGDQVAGLVAELPVLVADDTGRRQCSGRLAAVGDFSNPSGDGPVGYPVTVTAADCLDLSWTGLTVRLVVDVRSTPEPVLIVPAGAVRTDAGGTSYVEVATAARPRRVDVTVGLATVGEAEVTPLPGRSLAVGERVLVS